MAGLPSGAPASSPTLLYGATLVTRHRGGLRLIETELFLEGELVATVGRAVTMLPGTRVLELDGGLVAGLVRPGAIGPDLPAPRSLTAALDAAGVSGFGSRLGSIAQGDTADLVVFAPLRELRAETVAVAEVPALLAEAAVRHLFVGGRQRIREGELVDRGA